MFSGSRCLGFGELKTIEMNINYYEGRIISLVVCYHLNLTKVLCFLATKDDLNEIRDLLRGVLGVITAGILLVTVTSIIMGIM
jgi:hypothetical protein